MVQILHKGTAYTARALIDPGSEVTLVSEKFQKLFRLPTKPIQAQISGINGVVSAQSNKACSLIIGTSINPHIKIEAIAMVVSALTSNLPSFSFSNEIGQQLQHMHLADPTLHKSSSIDILIVGDVYPSILLHGIQKNVIGTLLAQETVFGWIITGPIPNPASVEPISFVSHFTEITLEQHISKFWEVEQTPQTRALSEADRWCESNYSKTTRRDTDGRYIVQLPFKDDFPNQIQLGESRNQAFNQFIRNELRLSKKPELKTEYDNVLEEYITLCPMARVSQPSTNDKVTHYYLPHHAVIKEDSLTTRLRVVFNASQTDSV